MSEAWRQAGRNCDPAGVSYSSQDLPCADAQDPPAGVCRKKVDSCICQLLLFLAGMLHVSMRT